MAATDTELICHYREGSQAAFRELVRRHIDMVFSAARRQTRSPSMAEEVTQSVFIKLARGAEKIRPDTPLAAWLHLVTRHTAINAVRTESRRQMREHASFEISTMSSPTSDWTQVEPLLDEAVAALRPDDRSAIILRFFEDKNFREVGEALGSTEEAARKRISRALEELRAMLMRRDVPVSSSVLAADLATHSIQAAPAGLSAAIFSGAALPATALPPAMIGTATAFALSTLQKVLLVAIVAVTAGVVLYQARRIALQVSDIALLQQKYDALVPRQEGERQNAATGYEADSHRPAKPVANDRWTASDRAIVATMSDWVDRATRLRDLLKASSMWVVPEFRVLQDIDWLDVARDANLETDADIRNAFHRVRGAANNRVAALVRAGLKEYAHANGGMMPGSAEALSAYFDSAVDPEMQLTPLTGSSLDRETKHFILQRVLDSDWFEKVLTRATPPQSKTRSDGPSSDPAATSIKPSTIGDSLGAFNQALSQFKQAHVGQTPTAEAQLEPFLTAPMNPALLRMLLEASQGRSAFGN